MSLQEQIELIMLRWSQKFWTTEEAIAEILYRVRKYDKEAEMAIEELKGKPRS